MQNTANEDLSKVLTLHMPMPAASYEKNELNKQKYLGK
jgi:hypothetical protein